VQIIPSVEEGNRTDWTDLFPVQQQKHKQKHFIKLNQLNISILQTIYPSVLRHCWLGDNRAVLQTMTMADKCSECVTVLSTLNYDKTKSSSPILTHNRHHFLLLLLVAFLMSKVVPKTHIIYD